MKQLNLTPALYEYMLEISLNEHPVLKALREETSKLPLAIMQIPPDQAQFLQLIIRLLKATRVLELGTFTGYSALAMALAMPDDGQLITCDINQEWTKNAAYYWQKAHQEKKINLQIAPALTTLNHLLKTGFSNSFDFIFIDADKTNYLNYYELALQLIKSSGVIAIDNIFWEGKVIDPQDTSAQTREIRALNNRIKSDPRVHSSLLPMADGLFLIQLRS